MKRLLCHVHVRALQQNLDFFFRETPCQRSGIA